MAFAFTTVPPLIIITLYVKLLLTARLQARRIAAAEVGLNAVDVNAQLRRSNAKS